MNLPKLSLCILFLFAILQLSFTACNDEEGSGVGSEVNFDQQAMLANIGENIIIPAYAHYHEEISTLREAVNNFAIDPTEEKLENARQAFKEAYMAWQGVTLFEFGPAEAVAFRMNNNAFPTNITKIENSISSNSWDLQSFTSVNQKGLPALDYLLFKDNALTEFTTAENAESRRQYLKEVTNNLNALALQVYNEWNPQEGNYLETFTSNTGSSAGSSLSLLVNQLNQGFEITKNKRLNIPRGGRSINEEPIPMATEAYYSGISQDLILANLESVESIFLGEAGGTDGPGLADNLDAHYKAGNIEEDLSAVITSQIENFRNAAGAIPGPLSEAVVSANETVTAAYNEALELVGYLKVDMPQALSVLISYIDNDGD